MKKPFTLACLILSIYANAQVGIGTTSPNSTLDVRGSFSVPITVFSTTTTAGIADNTFLFTGTSPITLTLPTAVGITGREYWIKNISSNSSTLTIATTSSQTIDGLTTWPLTQTNKVLRVISNGTNWYVAAESLPGSGTSWIYGGNNVSTTQNIGTTSNYDLPFITNNTEKMRLTSTGNLGVGTSTFNATYPERLLVDAGANGSGNYQNVIVGKGNTNSYAQLNIQNINAGTIASSDVVATSNNGSEVKYYIDMGINSSGNTQNFFGGTNDAYLYAQGDTTAAITTGGNLYLGTSLPSRDIAFLTGGGTKSSGATMNNERMRILSTGKVGIGNATPTEELDVTGNLKFSGALMPGGSAGSVGTFLISTGTGSAPTWFDASGYAWIINGNSVPSIKYLGTTNNYDLPFITNNIERMRISNLGEVGIGTSTFNGINPEKLIVNAGTPGTITDFQNVIVGKGNTNSYAQLNIQNTYSALNNSASSDVVATSDNGNESVNYIDMGINSGTNSTTGLLGGANTAYIYATGNNFAIGDSTVGKDLIFFTGGAVAANERLRATANGLTIAGSLTTSSYHSGTGAYTILATDYVVINTGAAATWTLPVATTCPGRIYRLVNQGTGAITLSAGVTVASGNVSTNLAITSGSNFYEILSDGTIWRRIN